MQQAESAVRRAGAETDPGEANIPDPIIAPTIKLTPAVHPIVFFRLAPWRPGACADGGPRDAG